MVEKGRIAVYSKQEKKILKKKKKKLLGKEVTFDYIQTIAL